MCFAADACRWGASFGNDYHTAAAVDNDDGERIVRAANVNVFTQTLSRPPSAYLSIPVSIFTLLNKFCIPLVLCIVGAVGRAEGVRDRQVTWTLYGAASSYMNGCTSTQQWVTFVCKKIQVVCSFAISRKMNLIFQLKVFLLLL